MRYYSKSSIFSFYLLSYSKTRPIFKLKLAKIPNNYLLVSFQWRTNRTLGPSFRTNGHEYVRGNKGASSLSTRKQSQILHVLGAQVNWPHASQRNFSQRHQTVSNLPNSPTFLQILQNSTFQEYFLKILLTSKYECIWTPFLFSENILLKDDQVKLADFGSCRGVYSQPPFTEYISTRWYRPPECLLTDGYYNHKMDHWGVGCVFFEILSLFPLFPGNNELDQVHKIHNILGTPTKELLAKF